jgi:tetratricopeptide (TPR) repeat protein/predicted aspartyl protease
LTGCYSAAQNPFVNSYTRKFFALCALPGALFLPLLSHAKCQRAALDLPVTISGTRPLIDAKINHQDVRFVVDSGAFFSMISGAKAAELKLKMGPAPLGLSIGGVGGSTQTPSVALAKVFTIANVDIPNVEFLVAGSEAGGGSDGLLGQNFLVNWNVEYDLAKGTIRLFRDSDCGKQFLAYWVVQTDQPYTVTNIEKVTPRYPHAVGHAYINGERIKVLFDSGAFRSLLSLKAAARAGVKVDSPGVVEGGLTGGIGQHMVMSYIAPFASFKFADGEEIKNARLRVADIDVGIADMLIGADFFLSHRIFVANTQDKLYFTYNGGPVFDLRTISKPAASDQAPAASAKTADAIPQEPNAKSQEPNGKSQEPSAQPQEPNSDASRGVPEDAAALARRGMASAGRGDEEHALADLTRAVELSPNSPEYLYERGQVLLRRNEPKKALDDLDAALQLKPDYIAALLSRAQLRITMRSLPEARADIDAVDRIAAKQADVRFELAFDYLRAGVLPSAIVQYDFWIAAHGEDARMAFALSARCKARTMLGQDLPAALADCNSAIHRNGKLQNPDFFDNLGLVRLRLGDYDKSIDSYDAALKIRPKNAWTLYGRGLAELKKNNRSEGEADIAEAVKTAPGVEDIYKKMGLSP